MKNNKTIINVLIILSVLTLFFSIIIIACGNPGQEYDNGTEKSPERNNAVIETAEKYGQLIFLINKNGITANHSVLVTVRDKKNETDVYTFVNLALSEAADYYTSLPLSLKKGDYNIADFMIIDQNRNVVSASPLEGSPLARSIADPLPVQFSINNDEILYLSPEIIDAQGCSPGEFGMPSQVFNIAEPVKFSVGIFIFNGAQPEMTNAQILVSSGSTVLYSSFLPASTSQIEIYGGEDQYTMEIIKPGYSSFIRTYSPQELKNYSDNPLIVILNNN